MTIINQIKAEIERRITDNTFGAKLELIDILAWLDTLEEKSEIPTNLDELLDDYFEKLVVPEHQIIFEDTYRKIATDFYNYGRNAK